MAKKKVRKVEIFGGPFDGERVAKDEVIGKTDIFTFNEESRLVHFYHLRVKLRTNGGRVRRVRGYFHEAVIHIDEMDSDEAEELWRQME